MRPHTVAFIGLLNYLYLKSGGENNTPELTNTEYELQVRYSKNSKTYRIKLRNTSSYKLEFELQGMWSCVAQIIRSGRNFSIAHQHTPSSYASESFDLDVGKEVFKGTQSDHRSEFRSEKLASTLGEYKYNNIVLIMRDTKNNITYDLYWLC